MRPARPTAVHKSGDLAELVCSNSFRGDKLDNAVGLIKEEMRRLDSVVMAAAEVARVPAGAALAVDRQVFSREVAARLATQPLISVVRGEVAAVPAPAAGEVTIIATGPLTSDALSASIQAFVGGEHLAFYDAISPIVLADSIDMATVFRQSRWGRSLRRATPASAADAAPEVMAAVACAVDDGEGDYLNCPFSKAEYDAFYDALVAAESATIHDFDSATFFEGCLPIEVMAHRGRDTLRFGPMKPVGLEDPRTGRRPYAAVQLRQDTLAGDHFSLVGFQTQLKWGEQARVLRMIPGLGAGRVRSLRHGAPQHLHQWTDGAAPDVADPAARRLVLRRADLGRGRLRGVGGVGTARRSQRGARGAGTRCHWWRRARPRSAPSRTTPRTPIPGTTSRRTSPSASCRRSTTRPATRRSARPASPTAR